MVKICVPTAKDDPLAPNINSSFCQIALAMAAQILQRQETWMLVALPATAWSVVENHLPCLNC